jgi:hypothetical protein
LTNKVGPAKPRWQPQQQTTQRHLELPHALALDDLLLGIWRRIYSVAQNRMLFGFIVVKPSSLERWKSIERLSATRKYQGSQVLVRALLHDMPHEPEKCLLDYILRVNLP